MASKLQPPLNLRCIEFREYLKGGVTRPLLVAAVDENNNPFSIVLKVKRPDSRTGHFNQTSLACELICSIIARAVGLPVPDYAIVEIPRGLPQYTKEQTVRDIFQKNLGSNFGTVYHEGLMKWRYDDEQPKEASALNTFEGVLSFDVAVMNPDRLDSNSNLLLRGDNTVLMIDHALALQAHQWSDSKVAASPCFDDGDVYKHCAYKLLRDTKLEYISLFNQWIENASEEDFKQLRDYIPKSWETKRGDLDRIFRFLTRRSEKFEYITNHLRRCVG